MPETILRLEDVHIFHRGSGVGLWVTQDLRLIKLCIVEIHVDNMNFYTSAQFVYTLVRYLIIIKYILSAYMPTYLHI